ncbi:MAG TPA: four helix bundle protein [Gemmatimonadaceae bacterium]
MRPAVRAGYAAQMQGFKHIHAWRRGHALAIELHRASRGFSRAGHTHLKSQLTRAADSIATNIVEGCGASTKKEFARFLDISIKSANETEHHLLSARELELLSANDCHRFTAEVVELRKMIFSYRKKILDSDHT